MPYILLGCLAFVVLSLSDLAAIHDLPRVKQGIGLVTALLLTLAFLGASVRGPRFLLPAALSWAGWPLLVASFLLLVYSLFLEIPFRQTSLAAGVGDKLVTTGTYALARHPGVLWLGLFMLALLWVSRSRWLLIAAPLWLALDVLLVWVQDRFYFPRMFPGYAQYQYETPMLIPTWKSISACFATLRPAPQGPVGCKAVSLGPEHEEGNRC